MPPPFQAAEPQPAPPMPREKPALVLTVEYGDSVGHIAQRYGVAAVAIIVLNELSHPYWLHTGQRLALPRADFAVARLDEPPVEASRYANGAPAITVAEIEAEPAMPDSVEPEGHARAEAAAPAPRTRATLAPRIDVKPEEPAPLIRVEPEAPEPPRSPGVRLARAEPEATPIRPTLYALARQSESDNVPLPPTRNTFLWPIEGRVISGFGAKPGGKQNDGINIAAPVGSEVRASQSGVVAYAGNELRGYGNLVLIRHNDGWMTAYAHNDSLPGGQGRRGAARPGDLSLGQVGRRLAPAGPFRDPARRRAAGPAAPAHPQVKSLRRAPVGWCELDPEPPGEVLHELPGHSARAGAPGHAPLDGFGVQGLALHGEAEMVGIAFDHGEERRLVAGMEAEPETETVREGRPTPPPLLRGGSRSSARCRSCRAASDGGGSTWHRTGRCRAAR